MNGNDIIVSRGGNDIFVSRVTHQFYDVTVFSLICITQQQIILPQKNSNLQFSW